MTIERMTISQAASDTKGPREQLATKAVAVLGYHRLAQALTCESALAHTLRRLGIDPLARAGVEAYKRRKGRPGMWSGHKRGCVYLAISAAWWALGLPNLTHLVEWNYPNAGNVPLVVLSVLTIVLFIIGIVKLLDSDERGSRIKRDWRRLTLSQYEAQGGPIPEFVLSKAIEIKESLPEVTLSIEHLFEGVEKIDRPTRDPFLVASLDDEAYYIDVWNEKEYESKL